MSKELNININVNGQNVSNVNLEDSEIKTTQQDQISDPIKREIDEILEDLSDTYDELGDETTAEGIIANKFEFQIRALNDAIGVFLKNNLLTDNDFKAFKGKAAELIEEMNVIIKSQQNGSDSVNLLTTEDIDDFRAKVTNKINKRAKMLIEFFSKADFVDDFAIEKLSKINELEKIVNTLPDEEKVKFDTIITDLKKEVFGLIDELDNEEYFIFDADLPEDEDNE